MKYGIVADPYEGLMIDVVRMQLVIGCYLVFKAATWYFYFASSFTRVEAESHQVYISSVVTYSLHANTPIASALWNVLHV